jgi:hypothetical protein
MLGMNEFSVSEITFRSDSVSGEYVPHWAAVEVAEMPELDVDALHTCMRGAAYFVQRTPNGARHETVIMNADKADNGVMLQESTSFSGALKNPGNMIDFARRAADNAEIAHVFIGSHGNYPSSRMPKDDRRYLKDTSRYAVTLPDGSAKVLDSFKYKAEALDKLGFAPTHLVGDEEAGRLVMPWMLAVESGTIKGVDIRGMDGISDHSSNIRSAANDVKSRGDRRKTDAVKGPGTQTPDGIKDVKDNMPQIFKGGLRRYLHIAPILYLPKDDINKIMLMRAYSRNRDLDDLESHAVYQDSLAALQAQDAPITLAFNNDSNQHDRESIIDFATRLMNDIPSDKRTENRKLKLLFVEGTTTSRETDPRAADAVQRYGLKGTGGHLFRIASLGANLTIAS